jgi:hypothetical protein
LELITIKKINKEKRRGMASYSFSVNDLASRFAGLDLGLKLKRSEYDMDIDEEAAQELDYDMEVEAFSADLDRRKAIFEGIRLEYVELNADLSNSITPDQLAEYDEFLRKVDYIHCKGFGVPTGIKRGVNQLEFPLVDLSIVGEAPIKAQYLYIMVTNPSDAAGAAGASDAAAAAAVGAGAAAGAAGPHEGGDILFLCILNIHGDKNELVDIWSVAKNPHIAFPNAFKRFLLALMEERPEVTRFYLHVGTDNTLTMTEQGRLRLYTSLGFLIQGAQTVRLIYPESDNLTVNRHDRENRGQLYVSTVGGLDFCSFLGNIQSSIDADGGKHPIIMMATKEDLKDTHSFMLGYTDSLRGRSAYLLNPSRTKIYEVPNILTDNEAISIDFPEHHLTPIAGMYHMSLENYQSNKYPGNSFIQAITVPDDFLIFTIASPGSYSVAYPGEFEKFTIYMAQQLLDREKSKLFVRNNKSTQKHPITNLFSEASYRDRLLSNYKNKGNCEEQIFAGLLTAKTMEQLGRQPFFEFPAPDGLDVPLKKYQLDFQLFGPGMKMFNFNMIRSSSGRDKEDFNFGTYFVDTSTTPATLEENREDHAFTDNLGKLKEYLDFIRRSYPAHPCAGPKYFLFLFGCSGLYREPNQYELLYELSHRRSVSIPVPDGVTYSNEDFIDQAIFNKMAILDKDCSEFGDGRNLRISLAGGGKRKKQTRKQKKRKCYPRKTHRQKKGKLRGAR